MKRLNVTITVGDYSFNWVKKVQIEKSRDMLTDTAEITLPKKVSFKGKSMSIGKDRVFKRGDKVSIKLGYYPELVERFSGYVKDIEPGFETKIICEDEMYLLKQETITKSYKSVTLKELLEDISPLTFETVEADLGQLRLTRVTPAQVLEKLEKIYKLKSWVQNNTLFCGLKYSATGDKISGKFRKEFNIISDSLIWRDNEDVKVKIKGVGIAPDNKKVEYETPGEADITLTRFYNVQAQEALKDAVERDLENLDFSGFNGDFETFGIPEVDHSQKIQLDNLSENHKGEYFVKKVIVKFGVGIGYKQQVFIDRSAN